VQLTDVLPGLVSYVPASCTGSCTVLGNTITWDLGSLAAGATGSRSYQVTVSPGATNGQTFTNAAQINSAENDANPGDNNASVTTTVSLLTPAVTFSPTSLTFGSQGVGTTSAALPVTLTNSGTAPLTISAIGVTGTNAGDF